jgi:hypothetical protein
MGWLGSVGVSSPLSAQVQAREGSAVAEERDFGERLAAIARELVHEPDMQHTLQRIVELAAADLDGEVHASVSLVGRRQQVDTAAASGRRTPISCSTNWARGRAWMRSGRRTPSRSMT